MTTTHWFTSEDLADRWNMPLTTVQKWRYEGTGPKGVKFGRRVRYSLEEVERWEREQAAKAS